MASYDSKENLAYEALHTKNPDQETKRKAEMLGIAYTPMTIVDFMVKSLSDLMQIEFKTNLGSKNVVIHDPFVGTGRFFMGLIESGLMSEGDLKRKYQNCEIFGHEIMVKSVLRAQENIKSSFKEVTGENRKFIYLLPTDTFAQYEHGFYTDCADSNIRVMLGNPPYSAAQKSANDNAANKTYEKLQKRITDTYVLDSLANNTVSLFNSYIKAFRVGADWIKKGRGGVMAFITGAGWLDSLSGSGIRRHMIKDFSKIYVFHLRGNQRFTGETGKKEGQGVFGNATRSPVAITFFIRTPDHDPKAEAEIYYHDIGDYLKREEKLTKIASFGSIEGISNADGWHRIYPDPYHDWFQKRDETFANFLALGCKKNKEKTVIFDNYSLGVKTHRDQWCYNPSMGALFNHMQSMINTYNHETRRLHKAIGTPTLDQVKEKVDRDPQKIKWSGTLFSRAMRGELGQLSHRRMIISSVRPFVKQWLYYDDFFCDHLNMMPRLFPLNYEKGGINTEPNIAIGSMGRGEYDKWTPFVTDTVPYLDYLRSGQFFPRYLYNPVTLEKTDAITDGALDHFKSHYDGSEAITKKSIFYYVAGILHSPCYRRRFEYNLKKELPRIPLVKSLEDFKAFSRGGEALAELQTRFEKDAKSHAVYALDTLGVRVIKKDRDSDGGFSGERCEKSYYRVEKMRWHGRKKDLSKIFYNQNITITNIPKKVACYDVGGRPALQWVVDYCQVKYDKESNITKDPNAFGLKQGNPRYLLDLVISVIAISVKAIAEIDGLPKMDFGKPVEPIEKSEN